ncbi:transketolase [Clostridium folliculivorans]|uniref:Transketolase n=1 Tax=Clostridium folliculivorans TaxID=2886038 RepID=A0A9W5Y2N6_9CLOT|nr:transketolase [Clostridium folliculivorans]GKU25430.1 transketolase [Clostridium folliculivorans]
MNADLLRVHSEKIREKILVMITEAQSGHPGGSLSIADILTVLYFEQMNINLKDLRDPDRDRFVLAKGHAAPALYATLMEKGIVSEEWLGKLRQIHSILQGHPDMKAIAGIDMSTGSLGQGLSAANGMALAGRVQNKDYRVYTILGDGECQEGQVWEAAMAAAHYKLDNLTAFLDFNGLQIDGKNSEVMNINPIDEKFKAFGWNVICIDGHDFEQINNAIEEAKTVKGKPTMIIAKTHKGKGVSFMEDNAGWHGVAPSKEQLNAALKEIKGGN